MAKLCHYEALQLPPTAAESEIRSAYRRQALSTHPDKGGRAEDDAHDFLRVVAAFEILSDPKRRLAYDQQRTQASDQGLPQRKRQKPAGRTNTEDCAQHRRKPQKEAGATFKDESKGRAASSGTTPDPSSTQAEFGSGNAAATPTFEENSSPLDLLNELLQLPRKEVLSRLKKMTEQELRHLVGIIDKQDLERTLPVAALEDGSPDAVKKKPETRQRGEQDVASPTPQRKRVLLKGVMQCTRKKDRYRQGARYHACIGCRNLVLRSQETASLDAAIDMHISLVRMRQHILSQVDAGASASQALKDAAEATEQERKAAATCPLKISFRVLFSHNRYSKSSRLVGQIAPIWEQQLQYRNKARKRREDLAQQRQLRQLKRKNEIEQRRNARKLRKAQAEARRRRRAEAKSAKMQANRVKKEAAAEKRAQRLRTKLHVLRKHAVMRLKCLQKDERKQQRAALRKWGVTELPVGLRSETFRDLNDVLCAELILQDGTAQLGPFRFCLADAQRDLDELRLLQRQKPRSSLQSYC